MPVQKPRARTDDLVIEEVDDELLVYDSTNKRGHCLSATAARVWRACDGYSDVSALSEALELDAEVVSQALDELDALELLDTQGMKVVQAGSGNGDGLTRRQLARRSATVGAGIAAAPLIYSINVSSAMALATVIPFQCQLFTTQSCGTQAQGAEPSTAAAAAARVAAPVRPAARPPSATRRPRSRAPRCRAAAVGTNCSSIGKEFPADAARLLRRQRRDDDDCGCGFGPVGGLLQPEHRCRLHAEPDGNPTASLLQRRACSSRTARAWLLQVRDRQLLRRLGAHAGRAWHAATRRPRRSTAAAPNPTRPAAPPPGGCSAS